MLKFSCKLKPPRKSRYGTWGWNSEWAASIPFVVEISKKKKKRRKCKRNIGGRKEYKQQSECRSLIFGLFSVLTLKCVLWKTLRSQRLLLWRLQYELLKCKQEKDFVYADGANWADQNLSSNIYFHVVNVNILFGLQIQWVRYSNCTNQGQTHPLQGLIWLDTTTGLICASLEIRNRGGDCTDFWECGVFEQCIYWCFGL